MRINFKSAYTADTYCLCSFYIVVMGKQSVVEAINKLSKIGKASVLQTTNQQCHYLHAVESYRPKRYIFPSRLIMKCASFAARTPAQ